MVVVDHVVVSQGVGRGEEQATGPVGVGAVVAYDTAIGRGSRVVDQNPGGLAVVHDGVGKQGAMGCFTDINAVIRVVGSAVIMYREPDKLIVRRARDQEAVVLGVFDFHVLQANEASSPKGGIGNFNPFGGDIDAITDQATEDGVLPAGCGKGHAPIRAHWGWDD